MPPNVRLDIQGALDWHEKQTGEKLTFYELEKRTNISRNNFPKWDKGESTKSFSGLLAVSKVTGYPIEKLIIEQ